MYHFELPGNAGEHSPHKTDALKAEEMVQYFVCYPFSFSLSVSRSLAVAQMNSKCIVTAYRRRGGS